MVAVEPGHHPSASIYSKLRNAAVEPSLALATASRPVRSVQRHRQLPATVGSRRRSVRVAGAARRPRRRAPGVVRRRLALARSRERRRPPPDSAVEHCPTKHDCRGRRAAPIAATPHCSTRARRRSARACAPCRRHDTVMSRERHRSRRGRVWQRVSIAIVLRGAHDSRGAQATREAEPATRYCGRGRHRVDAHRPSSRGGGGHVPAHCAPILPPRQSLSTPRLWVKSQ